MSDIEFAMSTYQRACGRTPDDRGVEAVWFLAYRCSGQDAARALPGTEDEVRRWLARRDLPLNADLLSVFNALRTDLDPRTATQGTFRLSSPEVAAPHPRRRTTTPKLLRETAGVYRSAIEDGLPPTAAVAKHFAVSHRTAARWVNLARRDKFLGPAQGTKAGEIVS